MKYSARFSLYNKGKYNDDNPRPRYCGLNTLQRIRQCVLCLNRQNRARVKYTKADKKKWKEQSNPEKTLKSQWEAESLREKRTKKSEAKKQQKISPWSSCWALLVVEGAMALFKIRWCIRGPKTPARWGGKPRASSMACQNKKILSLTETTMMALEWRSENSLYFVLIVQNLFWSLRHLGASIVYQSYPPEFC